MEAAPPSYANATQVDRWNIVARYIPSDDLCSAALVCRSWHTTFAPHLWGNPASHFGIENDAVYVALTRFIRTLRFARLVVRSLTHTLHLPPAHTELYNGPHSDWLRDNLDRLPNLQSLIVRGLPFFDHSALQALRYKPHKKNDNDGLPEGVAELPGSSAVGVQFAPDFTPSFGLRFLDASRCPNVTSGSLAQALKRFEGLLYLDLSFTLPARDPIVLKTLSRLHGLQVLKVRGIHLTDQSLAVLASALARRVRSLDIRDNEITDRGVRILLDECFLHEQSETAAGRRSPALLPYMGFEMLSIYQGEDFESYLRSRFTKSFVGRLAIEDTPEGGITHLYIANNALSVEGVSGLIRSKRLHVLDVDSVANGPLRHPLRSSYHDEDNEELEAPGIEKLTPILFQHASGSMTFLRIDHSLVTKDTPDFHPDEVIQGRVELDNTELPSYPNNAIEIDGTAVQPDVFELPSTSTPRYELPVDPMDNIPALQPIPRPVYEEPSISDGPRRGSAIAPEVADGLALSTAQTDVISPISPLEHGTGTGTNWIVSPITDRSSLTVPNFQPTNDSNGSQNTARPRSYSSVAQERKSRLNAHAMGRHTLHPAMLPQLSTLVLTNVPPFTDSKELSDRLITFVKQCAEEASLAKSQASLDYSLPPGRRGHAAALKYSANKIFALHRIVLELGPETNLRRNSKASLWQNMNTKSVTEDRDSESLWSAAETDFSFFGDEEMALPTLEYGRFANDGNERCNGIGNNSWISNEATRETPPMVPKIDTVALISAFRKDRKAVHLRDHGAGTQSMETEGYWDGGIQVVRPSNSSIRKDEEKDYYGVRFERG